VVAAWLDSGDFSCAICEKKPSLKVKLGCDSPPLDSSGHPKTWDYPPEAPGRFPEYKLDRCPLKALSCAWDVMDLFSAGSAAEWKLSITERAELPAPYVEAWMMARNHTRMAESDRMKKRS